MLYFEPAKVKFAFILFFVLFFGSLFTGFKWVALIVILVFSSIFAYVYYRYFEDPRRRMENEEFMRIFRERLEARWNAFQPIVRNIEYYLKFSTEGGVAGIAVSLVIAILILALLNYLL